LSLQAARVDAHPAQRPLVLGREVVADRRDHERAREGGGGGRSIDGGSAQQLDVRARGGVDGVEGRAADDERRGGLLFVPEARVTWVKPLGNAERARLARGLLARRQRVGAEQREERQQG